MKLVIAPQCNSVVYMKNKEGNSLIPVLILNGQWEVDGRLSNFWYWYEIDKNGKVIDEDRKNGYGCFYNPPIDFKVMTEYKVEY